MRLKADLTLLFVALLWGFGFLAQSAAAGEVGALVFNGARWLLGALVMLPLVKFNLQMTRNSLPWMLVAGFILFLGGGLQQTGLEFTTVGNAGFITGIYVVLIPILLTVFWREKISRLIWAAAATTAAGVYFLSMGGPIKLNIGDLLMLLGAFMWAFHVIVIGKAVKSVPVLHFVIGQNIFCGALNLIFGILFQSDSLPALLPNWISILYLSVVSTAVGFTLQAYGQRHAPPADAAIILSMEAVFAALIGWLFLKEQLTLIQILGCGLIFAAIVFSQVITIRQNKIDANQLVEINR